MITRRNFLGGTTTALGWAAASGEFAFLGKLPRIQAAESHLPAQGVKFHPGIESLVQFIESTPRERLIEEIAVKVRHGLAYRDIVAALFLAGIRNIQPRPIGFKFHAVMVVNSAHLASLASSDSDRWLPIFWALDQFKSSQAADVKEGDWMLGAVEEARIPKAHQARQAFIEAMNAWDESAADAAITGLVRHAGAAEIFELLCPYGVRDFRELGHKLIYLANSFRTLEVIGWHHAEPVLRGVVYAMLDRVGDQNPSKADLPADRPFRRNREAIQSLRPEWKVGNLNPQPIADFLATAREGSSIDTSNQAIQLLNSGSAPAAVFDGIHAAAGEMLMRRPGILSLHASTFTNAVRYSWNRVQDDTVRRLLLVQAAAFMPLFRGEPAKKTVRIDQLEPLAFAADSTDPLADVFAGVGKNTEESARRLVGWLAANPDPKPFAQMARRLVFSKGRDSHDYKFSSAVLEDYEVLSGPWRNRVLAASVFNLRGSGETDNPLVGRIRDALATRS